MLEIPGFVDLQVNGYLGVDYSSPDLTEEDFLRVTRQLLDTGCIGFLPTVCTASEETYRHVLPMIAKAIRSGEFAGRILGIHAEGPFLSPRPGAVGAHNPDWVRPPSVEFFKKMQEWADGTIKILTLAAENPGAEELTRYAAGTGVVVSLGHQMATAEDLARCADAGATWLTHLGNGMPNEVDRHRNPMLAGLAEDRLTAGIITDSHHLPGGLVKVMIRAKGVDRVTAVSDASSLAGLPPGHYHSMNNDVVIEENGYLHNPAKKCLVGSSATITGCVKILCRIPELSGEDIVKMTLDNPLKLIGLKRSDVKSGNARFVWDAAAREFRRG